MTSISSSPSSGGVRLQVRGVDKHYGARHVLRHASLDIEPGEFVAIVGRSGAQSVAYFLLSIVPAKLAVAMIFVIACFVSTAMGTSVGTITLIQFRAEKKFNDFM